MNRAMITVEVLISLLILFTVVTTSSVVLKHLRIVQNQQGRHQMLYIAVLNAKAKIERTICDRLMTEKGEFNGYAFVAECQSVEEKRSYLKDFDENGMQEGNIGRYAVRLFKVTLTLSQRQFTKEYIYYKTVVESI